MPTTFITGPVRSGKSRFAERLARHAGHVVYAATAAPNPDDPEWVARIAAHRRSRPLAWETVETAGEGRDLAGLVRAAASTSVVIVDSLGTWLASLMSAQTVDGEAAVALESELGRACDNLDAALRATSASVILVSEEVGWGIVPIHPSARVFRDVLGRLHQAIAEHAERVYLIVNGFAIDVRAVGAPIGAER